MIQAKIENHRILEISQEHFLNIAIESFLTDRKAAGLAGSTVEFYSCRLQRFTDYCESQAVQHVQEIIADFLRHYLLALAETHNPGGVHGNFRALRVFLRWIEAEEIMPPEWKNPIRRVKPPRVDLLPIGPVPLEDVHKLLDCGTQGDYAERDRAIFLFMLDTGVRAGELCNLNWDDLDLASGVALIRQSKGRRPRIVCFGRKTRRALNKYYRSRKENLGIMLAGPGEHSKVIRCTRLRRTEV